MLKILAVALAGALLSACATAPSTRTYGVYEPRADHVKAASKPTPKATQPAKARPVKARPTKKRDHWWNGGWWLREKK